MRILHTAGARDHVMAKPFATRFHTVQDTPSLLTNTPQRVSKIAFLQNTLWGNLFQVLKAIQNELISRLKDLKIHPHSPGNSDQKE